MDINKVLNEATKEIEESSNQLDLQNVKVAYLGKKGKITELLKSLKDLSPVSYTHLTLPTKRIV